MKALERIFATLFMTDETASAVAFPVSPVKFHSSTPIKPSVGDGEIIGSDRDVTEFFHSHRAVTSVKGTVVSLRLDKIGLKDAQTYIDPFMTVLVVDDQGLVLDKHDVPAAKERGPAHVMINSSVYLAVPLEDMQKSKASIFLEFKHFKPKKKKISTRCWTFMELSELKRDEEIVLELYTKPTDLRKKKVKLHTEKPLYAHLYATFICP